jgi:hypothetical protein
MATTQQHHSPDPAQQVCIGPKILRAGDDEALGSSERQDGLLKTWGTLLVVITELPTSISKSFAVLL